jgi:hypothetical protein
MPFVKTLDYQLFRSHFVRRASKFSSEGFRAFFEHFNSNPKAVTLDWKDVCRAYNEMDTVTAHKMFHVPEGQDVVKYLSLHTTVITIPKTNRLIVESY